MGNVEKLAILIVLFLSAVVLAVSLGDSEGAESGLGPVGAEPETARAPIQDLGASVARAAERESSRGADFAEPRADDSANSGRSSLPVLDAGIESSAFEAGLVPGAALESERAVTPTADGILTTRRGLSPSFVDDYMEYTVESGDTWSGLALRFYSDARMVSNLKIANDDLSALAEGTRILVPVRDLTAEATQRERYAPAREVRSAQPSGRTNQSYSTPSYSNPAPRTSRTNGARATTYTVVNGDNLSKVAKKVFGSASRWAEIYEANKAKLESPDWLTVGMELRIPRDGEFAGVKPPKTKASAPAPSKPTARVD